MRGVLCFRTVCTWLCSLFSLSAQKKGDLRSKYTPSSVYWKGEYRIVSDEISRLFCPDPSLFIKKHHHLCQVGSSISRPG
jgi:hypothetical protein